MSSIQTITPRSPNFPKILLSVKPKIKKLFFRGNWDPKLFTTTLSIIGSRRSTRYGQQVVEKFMPDLVANQVTIVSGFMYGIDTLAHQTCLSLGGKTIAVIGSGLDYIYPPQNEKLYYQIIDSGGLIISEYEPDFKPTLWSFPQRNRIISGLSTLGVLIIEANIKSGSLTTAKFARQQNKPLFAIPGPITSSSSSGTNYIIKTNMAQITTSPQDILSNFPNTKSVQLPLINLSPIESQIIQLLKLEPLTLDELSLKTNLSITQLSTIISSLTLNNLLEDFSGQFYLK